MLTTFAAGLTASLAPSLAQAEEPQPAAETEAELQSSFSLDPDPAVYGGWASNYCGWPTTTYLAFNQWSCTGTLVHPNIVVTAAHCAESTTGRPVTVHFGEEEGGGERSVSGTCYSNPGWTGSVGPTDYGYCLLGESVDDIQIVPPAVGCETDALSAGREVQIVGFGLSNNGGSGTKREVTTTINGISQQASVGGDGLDSCSGDSGGPVFIKLSSDFGGDDTWRVFGITSGGGECGTGGIYALMHVAIPWVEEHSGVDVTPCHDLDDNDDYVWAPTPDCGGFPYDPGASNGSWSSGCQGDVSGFSGLCGEPFGAEDDMDPPTVEITAPADGTTYDTAPAEITVSVAADDGEGYGVAEVRLLVNGEEFGGNTDGTAPYEWAGMVFPQGAYTLTAIAVDYSGNEAISDPVDIGVGEEAPDSEDSGDSGDSGGSGGDSGGDSGSDDDGADEVGGEDTGGGDVGLDDDLIEIGCACAASQGAAGGAGGLGLGALFGLGLLGYRRRRRQG
ncbi:trypsin-like serine protease [Pseudenhygromyxa sp. WMMC2535]|uniref:trypsin-like serine protease n=1 Tax=Pseudenhygromyxa sp. WMMC2535 TaxID=2712867 RepID=UPI0020D18BE0|nr:trypsin-like serine protease [Pseudenhygromyxa sp. WMMC2535]